MCVCVRVCVSVRIIISYIGAVDSSITATDIPGAAETQRPNDKTVRLMSGSVAAGYFKYFSVEALIDYD